MLTILLATACLGAWWWSWTRYLKFLGIDNSYLARDIQILKRTAETFAKPKGGPAARPTDRA